MNKLTRTINAVVLGLALVAAVLPAAGCGKKQTLQRPPIDPAPAAVPEPANLRIDTDQRGAYAVDVPLPPQVEQGGQPQQPQQQPPQAVQGERAPSPPE